jgi:hypothetical protein
MRPLFVHSIYSFANDLRGCHMVQPKSGRSAKVASLRRGVVENASLGPKRINLPRARTTRSALVAIVGTTVLLTLCASVRANWFNRSEDYLADCELEAQRRYYKSTSSHDVRRHIYLCMLAHGYAFRSSCDEAGWLDPGCYRLKYKTEGR